MTLLDRIQAHEGRETPRRICRDCHVHEAIADGSQCRECLARFLRRTRPSTHVSPFVDLAQRGELRPKVLA